MEEEIMKSQICHLGKMLIFAFLAWFLEVENLNGILRWFKAVLCLGIDDEEMLGVKD